MAVSHVDVVVLGLVAEEPLHGYELLERYRGRGMDRWAGVGRASVYQALRRLEAGGYVSGKAQEGGEGPDRRVYRITRPGRDRLRSGLVERFDDTPPYSGETAVALGLVHLVSADEARKGVLARERALFELRDRIAADRARLTGARGPGAALATRLLDRQDRLAAAELEWLGGFRRDLGRIRR